MGNYNRQKRGIKQRIVAVLCETAVEIEGARSSDGGGHQNAA